MPLQSRATQNAARFAPVVGEKPCKKCGEIQSLERFCKSKLCRDGHVNECNKCRAKKARELKAFRAAVKRALFVPRTEKTCIRCCRTKPLADFIKRIRAIDGYADTCSECNAESMRVRACNQPKPRTEPRDKPCFTCGEVKRPADFGAHSRTCDGLKGVCRACHAARRRQHISANPEKVRAEKRAASALKREREGRKSRQEVQALARAARDQKRAAALALKEQQKRPWNAPGLSTAEKFRIRYRLDPEFNLQQRVRASMKRKRYGISYHLGCRLRHAVASDRAIPKRESQYLDYTTAELKIHLERQFTHGMSWDEFCSGAIHIDHIRPLTSFDLSNEAELRAAWALANLQPLWAEDNLKKSDKLEWQPSHKQRHTSSSPSLVSTNL